MSQAGNTSSTPDQKKRLDSPDTINLRDHAGLIRLTSAGRVKELSQLGHRHDDWKKKTSGALLEGIVIAHMLLLSISF